MITAMMKKDTGALVPITRNTLTALVLDDDQFDRMRVRRLFREAGIPFYLDEADTLDTLKQVLDREDFDVILVDYNLAKSNGIQALEMVRNHPRNSKAATIMITSDDQSDVAVRAIKSGCSDYISKSQLSVSTLKASVVAALNQVKNANLEDTKNAAFLEGLADSIMSDYTSVLQPEIARIIRDMRALRSTLGKPGTNLPNDLDAIEKRCIGLWSLLRDPNKSIH